MPQECCIIEYCLSRPGVFAVMAGCHSIEEMEKAGDI
jgi:aryl-alcohol dehydrogenase-like predicted oxidoreductase